MNRKLPQLSDWLFPLLIMFTLIYLLYPISMEFEISGDFEGSVDVPDVVHFDSASGNMKVKVTGPLLMVYLELRGYENEE